MDDSPATPGQGAEAGKNADEIEVRMASEATDKSSVEDSKLAEDPPTAESPSKRSARRKQTEDESLKNSEPDELTTKPDPRVVEVETETNENGHEAPTVGQFAQDRHGEALSRATRKRKQGNNQLESLPLLSGKRERRAAEIFTPQDFLDESKKRKREKMKQDGKGKRREEEKHAEKEDDEELEPQDEKEEHLEKEKHTEEEDHAVKEELAEKEKQDNPEKCQKFENVDQNVKRYGQVGIGRGKELGKIRVICDKIEACSDLEIAKIHKGKVAIRDKLRNILLFNGFLPVIDEGLRDEDIAEIEEEAEAKIATKAFKFQKHEVMQLCDIFNVDSTGAPSKDDLINKLLNFLGNPSEKLFKNTEKQQISSDRKKFKKRATKQQELKEEVGAGNDGGLEDYGINAEISKSYGEPKMPSTKALRAWARAYLACFNLDKVTLGHAIETASDKFGINLEEKKDTLRLLLTEEL